MTQDQKRRLWPYFTCGRTCELVTNLGCSPWNCVRLPGFSICCFPAGTSIFDASSTVSASTSRSVGISFIGRTCEHIQGIWQFFSQWTCTSIDIQQNRNNNIEQVISNQFCILSLFSQNSLLCLFLRRDSVWCLGQSVIDWGPKVFFSLPLPGWRTWKGTSCSSGSRPQAHWFCWYCASGDCGYSMWWSSPTACATLLNCSL